VLTLFIGHAFIEFNDGDLQHGFRLAEMGLRRDVSGEKKHGRRENNNSDA
jgi:hypothetical protein